MLRDGGREREMEMERLGGGSGQNPPQRFSNELHAELNLNSTPIPPEAHTASFCHILLFVFGFRPPPAAAAVFNRPVHV